MNNNPMRVAFSPHNDWRGKVLPSNGYFERFISPLFSVRAWCCLVRNYVKRTHCSTLLPIVNRFLPPSEDPNDLRDFKRIREVVGPLRVDVRDYNFMLRLVCAFWYYWNKRYPSSKEYEAIREGIALYLNDYLY